MEDERLALVEVHADRVGGRSPPNDGARGRDEEHVVVDVVLQREDEKLSLNKQESNAMALTTFGDKRNENGAFVDLLTRDPARGRPGSARGAENGPDPEGGGLQMTFLSLRAHFL